MTANTFSRFPPSQAYAPGYEYLVPESNHGISSACNVTMFIHGSLFRVAMAMHENRYKYTSGLSFIRPFSTRAVLEYSHRRSTSWASAPIGVSHFIRIFHQI